MEKKINLLFVDDEEQFLRSLGRQLQARQFDVVAVNRGEQAIAAAGEHPIDIALVDLKMPGIDGEETLRELKRAHEWMEIVILTGHGTVESERECIRNGAYSYLQKPCRIDELMAVLMEAFKRKVMKKNGIDEETMNGILDGCGADAPRDVLRRLIEIDRNGGVARRADRS